MKSILIYPLVIMKKNAFYKFNKKYLKLSNETYYSRKEIIERHPNYSKYIIGSDQVWNYTINGFDQTYFMDFVEDKSKVFSFASSFGLYDIDKDKVDIYKDLLNQIPSLSVREERGAEIIRELTGKEAQVVGDPVFLLSKEKWIQLFDLKNKSKDKNEKDFILTYFLNENTRKMFEIELVKHPEFNRYINVKLAGGIKFNDFISNKVKVNFSYGPIDFLRKIYDAKYVFTDSFHATAFSILFNKNFLVFLSNNKGRDSRIINLLKYFEIQDRIFSNDFSVLKSDYNIEMVNSKCKKLRLDSFEFLKKNLYVDLNKL